MRRPVRTAVAILITLASISHVAFAKGWELGVGISSVLSGTIQISTSHSMSELGAVVDLRKQLSYKLKIFKKAADVWVGGELNIGDVNYSTGSINRQGQHFRLGMLADLRINWNKNYFSNFGLSISPYTKSSVFSKISSSFDGEISSSTSQTDLQGWGWSLPLSIGRWFTLKTLGLKLNFASIAKICINSDNYTSRSDTTVQIGQESQDVTVIKTAKSGNFAANYTTMSVMASFKF